jgi:AmiR/NasT family two-component response regulator
MPLTISVLENEGRVRRATHLAAAGAPTRMADEEDIDVASGMIAARHGITIPAAHERLREAAARAGITEGQAARVVRSTLSVY